jgi:F-type H+-transporting ATPase subunit gamma
MPTLLDFRRRIRTIKNMQQITRAMKFVAAAKLRRAQENALAARPYARQMANLMRSAMARMENPTHPLMARRAEQRVRVLALTGDKGLCGAFNTNVMRRTLEFVRQHADKELAVVPVGKKGRDGLRRRAVPLGEEYVGVFLRLEFKHAKEIAEKLIAAYSAGEIDAVYVVYNEFKSVLSQKLTVAKLLPIDPEEIEETAGPGARAVDYIYEQPPQEILNKLLPRFVETQVYRCLLESSAAEFAARMTAMDAATNNAGELIEKLTLYMNKVRQAAITKEIIEVVSGAAAAQ